MGSVRGRLGKLERAADGAFHTVTLDDGTKVRFQPEEMLGAISAAVRREEHWLLPVLRTLETTEGVPGLIRALEESRARADDAR